ATLVRAAELARGRSPRRYITIAGAVASPLWVETSDDTSIAELVSIADPTIPDWVAIKGGAPGGTLLDRDARAADAGTLILVLPAKHDVVRRLRLPLSHWLWRARSACESCRACSQVCPAGVEPDGVVRALSSGIAAIELTQSMACTD